MVMGLASMAPVSKLPTAAMFATVMMGGMVQSAMCQVRPAGFRLYRPVFAALSSQQVFLSAFSTQAGPFHGLAHCFAF